MNFKHICFTAFSTEERKELSEKAINLGLVVDTNFEIQTEVLIAQRIGTDKYRLATEKKIPILKKEWLLACETEKRLVSVEKYRLPCLYNCTISVTGFREKERKQIQQLCEQNGASYSSSLTTGYTHLICLKGNSEKFHFALSNNINVVSIDWIKKSVSTGYALDEADYILSTISEEEKQKCLQIANKFKQQIGSEVEEPPIKPLVKQSILQTQGMRLETSSTESFSYCSQYSAEDAQLSLFNGIVFKILEFPPDQIPAVRKLIRKYGGNVTVAANGFNYVLAHETAAQEKIKILTEKLNYDPPVVSYKWFLDCIENMQILPIEEKNEKKVKESSSTFDDNHIDIDISEEDLADAIQSQNCVTNNDSLYEKDEKKLFSGLQFKLADNLLSQKQVAKSIIERNGGKIVNLGLEYDFIIYPESCKTPRENNPKIRTLKWLKDSDTGHIVKNADECILYAPTFRLALDKVKTENEKVLIVISGYPEQKQILQSIIEALGGSTSKTMRKNADILVCEKKSDKSDFANKHQIPVVSEKWLIDSYKAGYFLSSTDFIFNPNSTNSNTPNISVKINTTVPVDKNIKDTSTTPTEKKSTNTNNTFELKKTEKVEKEDQTITPTKTVIHDENAQDSNSPHTVTTMQPPNILAPPTTPTTVISVDTAALANFKNKLLDKLPKKKDTTTKAIEFSEQSDVHFISKKKLESLTFFNSQNTSESNSLSHYGGTSEAENEYNEKVKNDRNRPVTDFGMSLGTLAETQVIDHDYGLEKSKWKIMSEKRHFLLSSLNEKQKKDVTKYILAMGGVIDEVYLPKVTTHFIAGSAVQTEKFLCSVAAGIWILCPQYIEHSYKQQCWVQEDGYEWIDKQDDIKADQKEAIKYLITGKRIQDTKTLPFSKMAAYFVDKTSQTNQSFIRIITAGGGTTVLSINDPSLTHIIIPAKSDASAIQAKYPNVTLTYEEDISNFLITDNNEKKVPRSSLPTEESEKKKRKVTKRSK